MEVRKQSEPAGELDADMAASAPGSTDAVLKQLFRPWDELKPEERRKHRDTARWLTLTGEPRSTAATALIDAILTEVVIPAKVLSTPMRPSTRRDLKAAIGAFLGDLLAAANRGLWVTGSTKRKNFTGNKKQGGIGGTAFTDVWRSMERAGLIVHVKGRTRPQDGFIAASHIAPIFRVTPELLTLAGRLGVSPWNVGLHFGPRADEDQ